MYSTNPATGEVVEEFKEHSKTDCVTIIEDAHQAWLEWKNTAMAQRARCMHDLAALLREGTYDLAVLITLETGKPIVEARSEIIRCAWACDYFADNAEEMLRDEPVRTDAAKSFVRFEPLGLLLAVMSWNFPFWQMIRCAAPNLMAGNGLLLKHASNVPGCAVTLEDLFRKAGFPKHLMHSLLIRGEEVGDVIAHPLVRGVTLTGSQDAGRAVAAASGQHLKKCILELGSSDPFVVLADADLDAALTAAVTGRMMVSGQMGGAARRFICDKAIAAVFTEGLVDRVRRLEMGDPMLETTDLGPLARKDLVATLADQIERSIERGAKVLLKGGPADGPGFFYRPVVLGDVRPGMAVYDEETFGPVAPVVTVDGEEEALAMANRTRFGLGATVWTGDRERGERLARRIEAGNVFVNALTRFDPKLPFGGIKDSGFGRVLSSYGIKEFVNIKTVWVD